MAFGPMLRRSSALVRQLSGCDRVYAIAFGEGARHFHLHLIPRHGADPASESWRVADLYRALVAEGGLRPILSWWPIWCAGPGSWQLRVGG